MTQAERILTGLGGADNVLDLEACLTRLRVEVEDPALVDEAELRSSGAHGVQVIGQAVQVIVGPQADVIAEDVGDLL